MDGWVDGWVDGWMDGWVDVKAGLRIAYSNQKFCQTPLTGVALSVRVTDKGDRHLLEVSDRKIYKITSDSNLIRSRFNFINFSIRYL